MKANFIIGKKQVILSALIVILGGAIYVNYLYANKDGDIPITQTINQESQAEASGGEDGESQKNYGDAQLVNGSVDSDDYFEEAQLQKTKSRDEAVETVKSVLENVDATEEDVSAATEKITEISKQINAENKIESLIKAKGFENCVVYLDGDSANVVVKTDGLTPEQAAQIKNIVLSEQSVAQENISITEVK